MTVTVIVIVSVLFACASSFEEPVPLTTFSSSSEPFRLGFPVAEVDRIVDAYVMGVDHDPAVFDGIEEVNCLAYDGSGYPNCYDEHEGTDFDLDGGFEAMDAGSATILSAADGWVIKVVDEHYDRCRLDSATWEIDCDGNPVIANVVTVEHPGGWVTRYKHLAQDSALVEVGQAVERGTPLALIGSSGWSTAPHLHLEVQDADGTFHDPFAGPYSSDTTLWCEQEGPGRLPGDC